MAASGNERQSGVGDLRSHPLGDRLNLWSRSPTMSVDRHRERDQPVPQRRQRSGAKAAEGPRETSRRVAQPVGGNRGRHLGGCPASTGVRAQRLANSSIVEDFELGRQLLVAARRRPRARPGPRGRDWRRSGPAARRAPAIASAACSAIRPPIEYPTSVNVPAPAPRCRRAPLEVPAQPGAAVPPDVGRERREPIAGSVRLTRRDDRASLASCSGVGEAVQKTHVARRPSASPVSKSRLEPNHDQSDRDRRRPIRPAS